MNGSSFVLIFNFNKEDSKIMDYMLQNFSQFYVRKISMTNLFKQEMHVTIIEYVTKYKLSSAADMLTHTNISLCPKL